MQFNLMGRACPGSCRATFFKHSTLVFAMRVSFVYVMLGLCSMTLLFAEEVKSQSLDEIRVSVELDNETLPQLFKKIQAQTGLVFAFRTNEINKVQPITIAGQTTTVKEILDIVLINTKLKYKQVNNSVIVFEEEPAILDAILIEPITGVVKDRVGNPIPGVSVFLKGTTTGTTTDGNGKYSIDLKELKGDEVLVFSFIGYKTFEIEIAARVVIDVELEEDTTVLGEVIINGGYYETTDKLKTGSIVKVTAKDIETQALTSPLLALQGRVPGLEISPSTGAAGVAPTIRIRGTNTLRTGGLAGDGNFPLYIVDGVPINSEPIRSYWGGIAKEPIASINSEFSKNGFDPLSTINPASIESIEVLKDGDATAIYGSRGANGVILITTKRANKSLDKTNLDVNFYYGIGQVSKRLDVLNTRQYLSMRREGFNNDGTVPNEYATDLNVWDTTRYTDWQELLLGGTANITDMNFGISSGSKNTSFRFNLGYHKESMVFPGDFGYHRINGQMSVNHISANEKFKVSASVVYGMDANKLFTGAYLVSQALSLPPNAPKLKLADGSLNWETIDAGGHQVSTWQNPLSYMQRVQRMTNHNLITSGRASYNFNPELAITLSSGFTTTNSSENTQAPYSSYAPEDQELRSSGDSYFSDTWRQSWIIEPGLTFNKNVVHHHFDVVVGGTWQNTSSTYFKLRASEYPTDALLGSIRGATVVDIWQDDATEYRYMSMYARIGYNWNDKYLINLTGRRDGSSRFGPSKRFGNFGSIGAAWIFSNEPFMKKIQFMNFAKLRGSYGVTGNDQIIDYAYYNLYQVVGETGPGGMTGISPYSLFNPNFAWETTNKLEGAIELSFLQSRISTSISWYRNRSSNQLISYPLSYVTGFESVISNFDALIENSGWEFVLSGDVTNSDKWRWNIAFNFSIPRNKLVKFYGIEDSPYKTIYKVGEPLSVRWLYTWKGVNPETGLYEVEDKNGDGSIRIEDDGSLFNVNPNPWYGGIINSVQVNNFDFSMLVEFAHQNSIRYWSPVTPGGRGNQPSWILDRWTHLGESTNIQRFTDDQGYQPYVQTIQSNRSFTNSSFVRLKTLTAGYTLPYRWIDKFHLQRAKVYLQGANLLTITKYKNLDPQTGSALPPLRTITIGVQLAF